VAKWCEGYRSGDPDAFPLPRPRRAAESHHLAVAVLRRGTRVALARGLDEGLLNDLWNFPSAFGASPAEALDALRTKLAGMMHAPVRARHGVPLLTVGDPIAEFRHGITYRAIQGRVYPVANPRALRHHSLRWFELKQLPQAAISQLARKVVEKMEVL
jgi:adenine-specific DNA glycosylase